ncbi:uncharacterized protein SEPMUDRAFT_151282 [Sphaerulina musiva SO2202]|uniref:Uncharacterized protein n=1 Tax=Sphaerulina musiva (strain SO2202) TaxID=692275 RepID=M3D1D3_SPHMS|nr:uncharacterized protein SEPMUDRAFT_151282 [Sphaerulina musiva SO2202]EMF10298.1 hypothetical protein SEPMUDRAFT_151282 [Sphaerulina musiva SO2202]
MSKGFFTGPNIAAGAALTGAIVYFASRGNMYETHGAQNVANAYSRGGGTKTHAAGVATKLGEAGTTDETKVHQQDAKGIDTEYYKEHHAQQRIGEPGGGAPFGKKLNEASYGHKEGK